jgi:hypothetical protein
MLIKFKQHRSNFKEYQSTHQIGQDYKQTYTEGIEHPYCQWKSTDLQTNHLSKVGNRLSKPALEYKP